MSSVYRRPLITIIADVVLVSFSPPVPRASARGPSVSYPLRHDFSLVPGLPGHGKTEPTSCYDTHDGKGYLCRIVAGYEETGYDRNFTVKPEDALDTGHHRSYGTSLVGRAGSVYEGCRKQGGNWICDYKTRKQVSRDHYETKGHVARTFWKWKDYIKSQASCAGAISGLWAGAPRKGLLFFLDECNNGPM